MALWRLRLSILATLAFLFGVSTLFFTILLTLLGTLNFVAIAGLVVGFNLLQWLIAPKLVDFMYHVKALTENDAPRLYRTVRALAEKSRIAMPQLMLAKVSIPNAFAYGSPVTGNRVAVTQGLLDTLEEEEVEAVVGHELGHLKHRDVQVMMLASVLPAIFYYIGYSLWWSSWAGGSRSRNGGGSTMAVAMASIALYWILSLVVLGLSRLREYYADRHAVGVVPDGPRKLSEGLAKIVAASGRLRTRREASPASNAFKTLFISDPDHAPQDSTLLSRTRYATTDQELVRQVLTQPVTGFDRFLEIFSTHPNIVKRLRALQAAS